MCAVAAMFVLASCDKNADCNIDFNGDCLVEQLVLDSVYKGTVDMATRSVVVRVPLTYDTHAMEVTGLKLSNGAKCNLKEGMVLDMNNDQNIHVTNGGHYFDWTLTVKRDEARIYTFVINGTYSGIIDEDLKTIDFYVPSKVDVKNAVPTIITSENATVIPASGSTVNLTDPVVFRVVNNTAWSEYLVTVHVIDKPKALFVSLAPDMSALDKEEYTACRWMTSNISESLYASFDDIINDEIDLSECEIIWWHFHKDFGVDGHDPFVSKAPQAVAAAEKIKNYYLNGGNLFLTRYASIYAPFIGATGDDEWATPNNCWGGEEATAEACGGPWDFLMEDEAHPLFNGLVTGPNAQSVYCTDKGYHITNSTAQYHIGTDWGGYDNYDAWKSRTGAKILGKGGDGAIVAWEFPAHDGKGGILCIGSGCYDWYSYKFDDGYDEYYHKNIATMTKNAFNYLTK